jgi:hypothetical protein
MKKAHCGFWGMSPVLVLGLLWVQTPQEQWDTKVMSVHIPPCSEPDPGVPNLGHTVE